MGAISDTLRISSTVLQPWKEDEDYHYDKDIMPSGFDFGKWLDHFFSNLFDNIFGNNFYQNNRGWIWTIIAILILVVIAYLIFRYHPDLFKRNKSLPQEYTVTGDTIYGVDFPEEIEKAIAASNFREAVRLVYLQTLKWLSDAKKIDWKLYKTPTQYTYEVRTTEFRRLTNHFLRVRYGGFEADKSLLEAMQSLQRQIEKGEEE